MRRHVVAVSRREELSRAAPEGGGQRLHHRDHAQPGEPRPQIRRADRAVLHAVPLGGGAGGLDRVAHRLDRAVADRMRGDLQPCRRRSRDQCAKLVGRRPPGRRAVAHGDPVGAPVDEDLYGTGAQARTPEMPAHAERRGGVEQLPAQELVDPHPQAT